MRILQRFLGIDVEPNGGAGGIGGRVGEDDAGWKVPDGAFAIVLYGFEVALDMSPVPVGFLFVAAFGGFLLHSIKQIMLGDVMWLHCLDHQLFQRDK